VKHQQVDWNMSSEPQLITDLEIHRPSVVRRATTATNIERPDSLPLGIKVTGGPKLRAAGLTGQGVRVAVIDSGVDKDHPGFNGCVKKQTWFRGGTDLSKDDHGTHVAGTIHLMAPDAEIYDYRVFGETGSVSVTEAVSKSIMAAVADGCHVVNMSLGGPMPDASIHSAVQFAHSKGVYLVCAAGNEGDNNPLTNENSWPANHSECISIAAVKKEDDLPVARFSNSNDEVDYAGIGVEVVSFKAGKGHGYQEMSGTSMACPHVCGFIAALLTVPENRGGNLREILTRQYVIDIGTPGTDRMTGVGFVTNLTKSELNDLLPDVKPDTSCVVL